MEEKLFYSPTYVRHQALLVHDPIYFEPALDCAKRTVLKQSLNVRRRFRHADKGYSVPMADTKDSDSAVIEVTAYAPEQGRWYCDHLERGKILFFRGMPFELPDSAIKFLLGHGESASTLHKNISYRPANDVVKGSDLKGADRDHLHAVMRTFSREVTAFITQFLPPYGGKMKLDYASFRPEQEAGRRAFPCTSAMICCMLTLFPRGLPKARDFAGLSQYTSLHVPHMEGWRAVFMYFFRGLPRLAENQSAARARPMIAAVSAFASASWTSSHSTFTV